MNRRGAGKANRTVVWMLATAMLLMPLSAFAQTKISYHSNKFKPEDDVRLGRQAASEAERQFPLLRDAEVGAYVERIGQRLVSSIPEEFQHPEFRYYFKVVNASDINAFALPGGPMYVNRGMIEAARTEGEIAGVMSHELAHVALRHGTAQATKAQKYSTLTSVLGIGGAILGGPLGAAAQIGAQGVGVYFLKFSREYETEADILGARIMSTAGYNPRDLANVFRTIEAQGGGGGGFMSDHPSPQDRYARINQEAQYLRVSNPIGDTQEFYRIKDRLRRYPRAQSMAEIQRSGQRYPSDGGNYPTNYPGNNYPSTPNGRVPYPSGRYQTYTEFGLVRISVPDNWREIGAQQGSVWFSPEGAYGSASNGQTIFTHGINIGFAQTSSRNLQEASTEIVNSLQQGNRNLRSRSNFQRLDVNGRYGLLITMGNVNEVTGQREMINLVTTQLRNGQLFYMITVTPENEYNSYQGTFGNILRSIQLNG